MIRINTNIKGDLCSPTPSRLGVLGGDACGFPNGRRLGDDIVEIELLAVAGAAYQVLDGREASFSFNPALIGVLDRRRRRQRQAVPEVVPVLRPGAVRPDALPPEPGWARDRLRPERSRPTQSRAGPRGPALSFARPARARPRRTNLIRRDTTRLLAPDQGPIVGLGGQPCTGISLPRQTDRWRSRTLPVAFALRVLRAHI